MIALLVALLTTSIARADVPREMAIEIEAIDAEGRALEGEHDVTARLYAGGHVVLEAREVAYATRGHLAILLEVPPRMLETPGSLEIGIAIDADPEMTPRIAIAAVPFAWIAERALRCDRALEADRIAGVDPSMLQSRIASSCPDGTSIRAVDEAGAVACELDDVGPTYEAGHGIAIDHARIVADTTFLQRRVTGACARGESIRAIDANGAVTCERAAPRVEGASTVAQSGRYGVRTATLGPAPSRACFVTSVAMRELDVTTDHAQCRVRVSGASWVLEAILGIDPGSGAATDAYVECHAQCVAW